jgi:hypothetical protein
VRGHVGGKSTAQKILQAGSKDYARACDVCQRVGKPSHRDELPLQHVSELFKILRNGQSIL